MTTLGQYAGSLLANTTQQFGHNGETGVDIQLPYHTPVYALSSGIVTGSGTYGGGGVESILSNVSASNYSGPADVYYQHLSVNLLKPGELVSAGQLIGYSGGQIGYGTQPSSSKYSTGPHIEVGINPGYGGIWGQNQGPNVNPVPWLQGILGGAATVPGVLTGAASIPISANGGNPADPSTWIPSLTAYVSNGAHLVGWFVIALAVIAAGVWLLVPEGAVSGAIDNVKSGATHAAEVAALGA